MGKYIKFKDSWSSANRDVSTFKRWEDGVITTSRAMADIIFSNRIKGELTEEDFLKEAEWLGYCKNKR